MAKNQPKQNTAQPKAAKPNVKSVATAKKPASSGSFFKLPTSKNDTLLFDKTNYIIMGVGALLIILGFILMSGGGSSDPKVFNEAEIYSFRRITLAPIVVISGFVTIIIAILKKPANQNNVAV